MSEQHVLCLIAEQLIVIARSLSIIATLAIVWSAVIVVIKAKEK